MPRFLGITVLGDFILSEGVDAVLENLQRIGATAVACNPTVTAQADEATGSFQPPIDAGSSPRVFDRPLFGKTSLWVRGGPSYHPRAEFYDDSPYKPRVPNDLTDSHGAIIGQFIEAAVGAGIEVWFQVGAVQPSKLRDEDRPRLPNGELPPDRLADTGSLASPAIRAYNRAYIRDLLEAHPQVCGFRPDWPEYPCYTLGEVFQDFSPHVASWCAEHGFDFPAIREAIGSLYDRLHGQLTNADLEDLLAHTARPAWWFEHGTNSPLGEWLRLKTALSRDILRHWREIITEAGGAEKKLSANAFMPPYSLVTGLDFRGAAKLCDGISPKFYTMHWSLMVKFWAEELLAANPGLDEELLVRTLVQLMDIADAPGEGGKVVADYGYPDPDEPHPIPDGPQRRKIADLKSLLGDATMLTPLVHGYGPPDDFRRRLQLVADSPADGVWINRYGYLGDPKLDAIAEVWH